MSNTQARCFGIIIGAIFMTVVFNSAISFNMGVIFTCLVVMGFDWYDSR